MADIGVDATVTVWRSIGQAERDLVAASGWRAWPRLPEQLSFAWTRLWTQTSVESRPNT